MPICLINASDCGINGRLFKGKGQQYLTLTFSAFYEYLVTCKHLVLNVYLFIYNVDFLSFKFSQKHKFLIKSSF